MMGVRGSIQSDGKEHRAVSVVQKFKGNVRYSTDQLPAYSATTSRSNFMA